MRLTRRVFSDLAIWMILLGILVGLVFPVFMVQLGVPGSTAYSLRFVLSCMVAGMLAGVLNFILARTVVCSRLRILSGQMKHVEHSLLDITSNTGSAGCTPEKCAIVVDSDDEIGQSAAAFNSLVEAFQKVLTTQSAIQKFSEMLSSHLEISMLAENGLDQLLLHTGSAAGIIACESSGELKIAAVRGLREPLAVLASDHVRKVLMSGTDQLLIIPPDVHVEGVLTDFRPQEVTVVPITFKNAIQGIVILATAGSYTIEHRQRLQVFLQGLGLALNNAIIHERLQRLAALDPLTGLYNRRFGEGRLREEFSRAVRAGSPLGLLMLDIDHFKSINDTYGHLVGDRILKAVATAARGCLREGDILIRFGGEEFLAVLPAAAADDLIQIGERLRRSVEDLTTADGDRVIRVTMSLGGAAYPGLQVEKEEALVKLADEALYRAKYGGRNRVEISR